MTQSQKLQFRMSKIKQRLAEINKLEGNAFTPEIREEAERLQTEYTDKEVQFRSALIAEGHDDGKANVVDGEVRERRRLASRARLSTYFDRAWSGVPLDGAEKELNEALKLTGEDAVPIDLLADVEDLEARASGIQDRAVTSTPGDYGENVARITLPAFAQTIAARLGVRMPVVGAGKQIFMTMTTKPASGAGFVAKSAAADATAGGWTTTTKTPQRLTGRVSWNIEGVAELAQLENALRRALRKQIADKMDQAVIDGLYTAAAAVNADGSVITWATWQSKILAQLDGVYAGSLREVSVLVGPDTFQKLGGLFRNTNSDLDAWSYTENKVRAALVSSRAPAKASSAQKALVVKSVPDAPIEVPVWRRASLVRDPFTDSGKGIVHATLNVLATNSPAVPHGQSQVKILHPKLS